MGKLQSSFNIAGSWADMVTISLFLSFFSLFSHFSIFILLQKFNFYFEGSLTLETNGGLMVFKSFPAKEPQVGHFKFNGTLFDDDDDDDGDDNDNPKLDTVQIQSNFICRQKLADLGLALQSPEARQECFRPH